jgi:hypothetical protein
MVALVVNAGEHIEHLALLRAGVPSPIGRNNRDTQSRGHFDNMSIARLLFAVHVPL